MVLVLLFICLPLDGAFALRNWGPIAVLVLVVLACAHRRRLGGWPLIAVASAWAFAGWTLLSAVWSQSPGLAVEGAALALLFAGIVAVVLTTLPGQATAVRLGALGLAGLGLTVLVTLIALFVDGQNVFLAGRLDTPIGYRNATAALFAMAFWPLACVAASRQPAAGLRALCFALAQVSLGLAYLTQSRGVLIGFGVGTVVVLALGPDRLRRAWLLVLGVAGVAGASRVLLDPYQAFIADRPVTDALIRDSGTALAVIGVAGFGVVLLLALFDNGLRAPQRPLRRSKAVAAYALVALVAVGGVAGLAAVGNPVDFAGDKLDEFRTLGNEAGGEQTTRLGSTGGRRYDFWRVAVEQFRDAPILGVGEGSYRIGYYELRRTNRNITDPHSLPMRVLAETGIVGVLLLGALFAGLAGTLLAAWRLAPEPRRRWASAAAAAGAVVVGQSSVDFLAEIPAMWGLGLVALALAAAMVMAPARPRRPHPRVVGLLPIAALVAAAALVTAVYLSDFHTRKARVAGQSSAVRQLEAARTARDLNPLTLTPLLLEAGATEELGRVDRARELLTDAIDREPRNFVTYALLGDLEVRAGRRSVAVGLYRRALELNPLDVGLQELARSAGSQ